MSKEQKSNCDIDKKGDSSLLKTYTCMRKNYKREQEGSQPKCSQNDLDSAIATTPKLLIVHTQPGCPWCPGFLDLVNEMFGQRLDVVFAELNSKYQSCDDLSMKLNLIGTPTIVFFKNGVESGRYAPIGKTEARVKADLLKLVS